MGAGGRAGVSICVRESPVASTHRFLQLNGPGRCDALEVTLGRSSIIPCESGLRTEPGESENALATMILDGDVLEVHNKDQHGEIVLNGRFRKPFGTKLRLRHGDTLTVGEIVLLFETPDGDLANESMPEVVVPAEGRSKILGQAAGGQDAAAYFEGIADPAKAAGRMRGLLDIISTVGAGPAAFGGSMKKLFKKLLAMILQQIPAQRGAILVLDEKGGMRRMASHPGRHHDVSRSIVREVVKNKIACLSRDAMGDDRFSGTSSIDALRIRSAMCAPLLVHGEIQGIINLDTDGVDVFSEDDLAFLNAIASQAALALENARLLRGFKSKDRLRHELKLAASIQKALLPKQPPPSGDLGLAGASLMANEVGGDYYDFIETPDDACMYICIGDVKGSGFGAGLVLATVRSYFHSLALWRPSPKRILEAVNRFVHTDTEGTQLMTAALMFWDEDRRHFVVSGAGHRPLIVWKAEQRRCSAFDLGGAALGTGPSAEEKYSEKGLRLDPGDLAVLYTDGVEKAYGAAGIGGFVQAVEQLAPGGKSPQKIVDGLMGAVTSAAGDRGGEPPEDDVTIVVVRRLG